jgi:uncharacterized protein YndB with AHSA1/START domain
LTGYHVDIDNREAGIFSMNNEAQKHDLVITRIFDAPIASVWKAWSDPDLIKQWWGPQGFSAPVAEIDFREGGTSLVCMESSEFGKHFSTWRYQQIVPMERIDYVHNLADENGAAIDPASVGMPPDFPQDQRHLVTFTALSGNQTEISVTEYGWTAGQMMDMSKMGMEQCLDKMAVCLGATP